MSEWQPIATVPNKTPVLVSNGRDVWSDEWRSGWAFYVSMRGAPTHWMPLPDPPVPPVCTCRHDSGMSTVCDVHYPEVA